MKQIILTSKQTGSQIGIFKSLLKETTSVDVDIENSRVTMVVNNNSQANIYLMEDLSNMKNVKEFIKDFGLGINTNDKGNIIFDIPSGYMISFR